LAQAERLRWLADYVEDLARFDAAEVRYACALWRGSDAPKMPSPGQLLALCQKHENPGKYAKVEALPRKAEPVYTEDHKAAMERAIGGLAAEISARSKLRGPLEKLPGETDVDVGRRLWPTRELQARAA
jgi:hypothetical protein